MYFKVFRGSLLSERQSILGSVHVHSLPRRTRRLVEGDGEAGQFWKPRLQEAGLEMTQALRGGCKNGK